jgi:flagellar motility protein MotE (MotC chaperone)
MVDEKKKKEPEVEVVGLDDETPQKQSLFGKLKKFILPVGIGIGSMFIMIAVYVFIIGGSHPTDENSQKAASESSAEEGRAVDLDKSGDKTQLVIIEDASSKKKHKSEKQVEKQGEKKKKAHKVDTVKLTRENPDEIEIDTMEIMKGLEFIFATPDQEMMDKAMTPQDSIDTLNWIQKEMAELDKKIQEYEKKKNELDALEYRVSQSLLGIEQAESSRIIKLARLYDGMKPHEVGKLFANLSNDVIISILPCMKPANASKILALLPPKRAARISTSMITVLEDK